MNIQMTARHLELSDALKSHVEKKFEKISRHFENITQTHVTMEVNKGRHIVEAKMHIPSHEIFAQHEGENMYSAIDALIEKLDRQIKKHKEKMNQHSGAAEAKRVAQDEASINATDENDE